MRSVDQDHVKRLHKVWPLGRKTWRKEDWIRTFAQRSKQTDQNNVRCIDVFMVWRNNWNDGRVRTWNCFQQKQKQRWKNRSSCHLAELKEKDASAPEFSRCCLEDAQAGNDTGPKHSFHYDQYLSQWKFCPKLIRATSFSFDFHRLSLQPVLSFPLPAGRRQHAASCCSLQGFPPSSSCTPDQSLPHRCDPLGFLKLAGRQWQTLALQTFWTSAC